MTEARPGRREPGETETEPRQTEAEAKDDWQWRRKIRANPHSHRIYKWVVGVVGAVITIVGLIAVPAPGPGWLIVFVGIGVLASEFEWAQRLLDWAKGRLEDWNDWLRPKPLWFKGVVGLVTAVLVGAIFYLLFLVSGIPGFFPDAAENWLTTLPGL